MPAKFDTILLNYEVAENFLVKRYLDLISGRMEGLGHVSRYDIIFEYFRWQNVKYEHSNCPCNADRGIWKIRSKVIGQKW